MGWKANLAEVFTWTGYPKSNGVVWNVREDCNQFTLTVSIVSYLESECNQFTLTKYCKLSRI